MRRAGKRIKINYDVLEIHFLEIPKLKRLSSLKDVDDPILEWLEFIDSDSKAA